MSTNTVRLLPKRELSREVWKLSGPVVIGMISQTLMNTVDTAMVGRLGAAQLAATGMGGIMCWTFIAGLGALHVGVQAIAARRFGEKKMHEAGKVLDNAILLAVLLGFGGAAIVIPLLHFLMPFLVNDQVVAGYTSDYIDYRLMGLVSVLLIRAFMGFFDGVGQTNMHMRVAILANALNLFFNWIFIYGNLGMPRMETGGAGIASTLGSTFGALYFFLMALKKERREPLQYFQPGNLSGYVRKRILRLAIPSSIHAFLVMLGFSVFVTLMAQLGTIEMAATNVAHTISSLSWLPGAGIGIGVATLIGQKLGEKNARMAEEYGWEAVRLGVLIMGTMGAIYVIFARPVLGLFSDDSMVIEAAIVPLRIIGMLQMFDAVGMVLSFALDGAGMNKWIMWTEISINWLLFLPLTWVLSFVFPFGVNGGFVAMGLYILAFAFMCFLKFKGGSWKLAEV